MEIVAIVALGRNAEQEVAPLAADLGVTPYEAGLMLRAATPMVALRTEDRGRALDFAAKLRARGHDAVHVNLSDVASSEAMFRPRSFRMYGTELVASGPGEDRRLAFADIFSLVRANHVIRSEDSIVTKQRSISIGRAAMTGGLMTSKTSERQQTRVTQGREPVLYVFRSDGAPWLMSLDDLRFDGLGAAMKVSKTENFEVLVRLLREQAPNAPYDARLLNVRVASTVVYSGTMHLTTSSAATIDILAHVLTVSMTRLTRPYR